MWQRGFSYITCVVSRAIPLIFIVTLVFSVFLNWFFKLKYLLDETTNKFPNVNKTAIYFVQRTWYFADLISWCDDGDESSIKLM